MKRPTLVTCFPVAETDVARISNEFCGYELVVSSQEAIREDIFRADVFCGHAKLRPIDWAAVVAQGRLRWIQSSAAGLDHCLSQDVIESEIVVSGCSGLFANQVAEQTMALLFGMIRRLPTFVSAQAKKEFIRRPTDELHGKSVGIVGFGGNGRRIAEMLRGIAAEIWATDKFPAFQPPEQVHLLPVEETAELFRQSDVVVVTLPLTTETYHFVDRTFFEQMKPNSYFVNVARGGVVDQADLIDALQTGVIQRAGLDVVDPEPLPDSSPLWKMDRVLITPHVGAQSASRVRLTTELLCLNRCRFESGATLINHVDKVLEIPHPIHRLRVTPACEIQLPKMA